MRRLKPLPTLLTLSLAAAFGGFTATALRDGLQQPARATALDTDAAPGVPALGTPTPPNAVAGQTLPTLAPMLERVMPAVVSVHTKQRVQVGVGPFGNDPFFRRLFPELTQERIAQSLGSGVIIDATQGLVLTNHHVIENADDVSVTLADGRTLKARFIGSDPDTDVALMKIPAQNLTAIPLADSSRMRVGDFVVAIGNPFGVGQTVTSGIVSAVGRSNLPGLGFQNFIQTDASINPGNSGGALVNLSGQLVGINTASFNPRGSGAGNIGLGFAIPVNLAINIKNQLQSNGGVVRRGTFGLDAQDVDERIARGLGLSEVRGVAVTRVLAGSAADKAGVRVGDVILAADGQRIDSAEALRNFQGLLAPDAKVKLEILRDGRRIQLTTGLSEQPRDGAGIDPRLAGAMFDELPVSLRQRGLAGVLVASVANGSRAADNGLRAGDVIVASSSGRFDDLGSFRASFRQAPQRLLLQVIRDGAMIRGEMR